MTNIADFNLKVSRLQRSISKQATEHFVKHCIDPEAYDHEELLSYKFCYIQWTQADLADNELLVWFKGPMAYGGAPYTRRIVKCTDIGIDEATCKAIKAEAVDFENKLKSYCLGRFTKDGTAKHIYGDIINFDHFWWGKARKDWITKGDRWFHAKLIPATFKVKINHEPVERHFDLADLDEALNK